MKRELFGISEQFTLNDLVGGRHEYAKKDLSGIGAKINKFLNFVPVLYPATCNCLIFRVKYIMYRGGCPILLAIYIANPNKISLTPAVQPDVRESIINSSKADYPFPFNLIGSSYTRFPVAA